MESHAKEIPLSRQMCASYDAFIASLPFILNRHIYHGWILRYSVWLPYVFDGGKHLRMDFVGAQLERPKFLEADGTSHEVGYLECLQRNLSYSLPLYTNVHVSLNDRVQPAMDGPWAIINSEAEPCQSRQALHSWSRQL